MRETKTERYALSPLDRVEAESIHILREATVESARPVMLFSAGNDSPVLLRLAQKAFFPGPIPFPVLHVDTAGESPRMCEFRDRACARLGVRLIVHRDGAAVREFDTVIAGARREEGLPQAQERIFSHRDRHGQADPKSMRPELWNLYNTRVASGESLRVFPLSNWTGLDVRRYVEREAIAVFDPEGHS